MNLKLLIYKALNKVCRIDVTQVLSLPVSAWQKTKCSSICTCRWLQEPELASLLGDPEFKVKDSFIRDFRANGFLGVVAQVDAQPVGLLFLVPKEVAARHNSGGTAFTGIAVDLPEGVYFLFKAIVKSSKRGQRINAAMLQFAVNNSAEKSLKTIVTTTDWTNDSFLKSIEKIGFKRCAMASEFVIAGKRLYQLPSPFDPVSGQAAARAASSDCVKFFVESESTAVT